MKKIALLLIISFNVLAIGDLRKKGTFGHNLSPNTYQIKKGNVTLGAYAVAVGITDKLMIGTSPWITSEYNMYNAIIRYSFFLNKDWVVGIQPMYFKTFDSTKEDIYNPDKYIQESTRLSITATKRIQKRIMMHLTATHEYFIDETAPYSLRRETLNSDPYQVNISSLFEYEITKSHLHQIELGVMGLNYEFPQLIFGTSIVQHFSKLKVQVGLSITGTPVSYFSNQRRDYSRTFGATRGMIKYDFSIHPEMQLQYFF